VRDSYESKSLRVYEPNCFLLVEAVCVAADAGGGLVPLARLHVDVFTHQTHRTAAVVQGNCRDTSGEGKGGVGYMIWK